MAENSNIEMFATTSRLPGLGFTLMQRKGKKHTLIQCGSCSLTPTQQRYTTIELECMTIQWAIRKYKFYLRGLEFFQVLTDHRPLVGIFKKSLSMLENPRLRRMREKIIEYCFEVKWVKGRSHYIADTLSRVPVFDTQEEELTIDCAINCQTKHGETMSNINNLRGREYT